MTDTKIKWATKTWNPIVGCSVVSAGCTNCYAMKFAARMESMGVTKYAGLTEPSKAGPVWNGNMAFDEKALLEPLKWKKPQRIFVNSMGDLFQENVHDDWLGLVYEVMKQAPQHIFLILTKRPAMIRQFFTQYHITTLPNVWLGVSVEDQKSADERIPILLRTPAAIRFISAEPLLGPIDLEKIRCYYECTPPNYCNECYPDGGEPSGTIDALQKGIDWVIVGGESGPSARPMHPDWVSDIRDQCVAARVPFFFKQMAKKAPIPDDLFIREFPDDHRS